RAEIDGNEYNLTTNAQGIAYLYHTPTDANPLRIDAEFIGNPLLRRSEQMGVLLVEKLATEIVLDNVVVTTVENSTFTAVLKDEDGDLLNNTEVDVYIDGEYVGTFETDTYGRLYYTGPPLPKGDFTISVVFAGSGNVYAGTLSESTLTVRPLRTTITVSANQTSNETTTFIAKLYDEFNKPLYYKPVAFFLDGVFIGIAMTDVYGVAMLNHTYTPGGTISAEFLGDSIYRESLDNRPFGISPISDLTNDTNITDNGTIPEPIVQGDIGGDDLDYDYDDVDIDADGTSRSNPLIAMAAAGNPIAMILFVLLTLLLVGLRRRRKN
ncbi:MAG: Ig-like domain-containing protein, partial [Methanobrevibacter sp.]|nr:Ig-like domain-containing protein [Methanobrevibacter sp.]